MSLDLYYVLPSPPCRAVMLLAKTLGLELNLKKTDLLAKEQLKPEFLKINPQHTVPTLVDDGFILWESHAILGYLVNQYGKDDSLYPKEPKKRAVIDQRLHFDTGVLFPRLAAFCLGHRGGKVPDEEIRTKAEEALEFLDKFMENQEWVAGSSISIADYSVAADILLADVIDYDLSKFPNVLKWYSEVKKAIVGYDEIQDAGAAGLKQMLATPPQKPHAAAPAKMTVDLYYSLASPPSRSVLLVARALGVDLNLKDTSVKDNENRTPEFLKINPQHCIPTLVDNGFALWESRAILGYLVDQYGKDDSLYPRDPKQRAVVNHRLFFDIDIIFPRLKEYFTFVKEGKTPDADAAAKVEETFEFLNKFLEGRDWLAGSKITIADFAVVVNVSIMEVFKADISKFQNVTRWLAKAKKTIEGYDEIQTAGNDLIKRHIEAHASGQK
ncbi:uncharacterized protein LOC110840492 [Zootermopsis nevadensis]|uniref:uncharacterized protein LOC110840492 n=1 Tax=Zootermopsis nevadensis TaxID=136037 RepID=UPI000B8E56B4|nr:uncharacterized protein LOC110840492 [Zootermopsis nevadensis]